MAEEKCYVYIIGTTSGAYKIGVANDPWARYDTLRPGIPDPSEILLLILCRNRRHAFAVENGLHRELDRYRSAGEWFRPPKSVLGELILELGSKIDALSADIPIAEYPVEYSQTQAHDTDIIAYGIGKKVRDHKKSIMDILRELDGIKGRVNENEILRHAEDLGIERSKTLEILDRMMRDGEAYRIEPIGCESILVFWRIV